MTTQQISINITQLVGAGVREQQDCADFLHFSSSLFKLARAKFYTSASLDDQFPVPFEMPVPSVLNYLGQTLGLCQAARRSLRGKDFIWCQAIYMVTIFALGGNFSQEHLKKLELSLRGSDEIAPLLNTMFKNKKNFQFGNMEELRNLLDTWNLKGLDSSLFGTPYTGGDLF